MMINHIIISSLVIIFVLLIGTLFENKISACLKYSLWLLVVVKLLLPIPGFESRFHIMNFIESYEELLSDELEKVTDSKLLYEPSVVEHNNMISETNHPAVHNIVDGTTVEIKGEQESEKVLEDNNENKK